MEMLAQKEVMGLDSFIKYQRALIYDMANQKKEAEE